MLALQKGISPSRYFLVRSTLWSWTTFLWTCSSRSMLQDLFKELQNLLTALKIGYLVGETCTEAIIPLPRDDFHAVRPRFAARLKTHALIDKSIDLMQSQSSRRSGHSVSH